MRTKVEVRNPEIDGRGEYDRKADIMDRHEREPADSLPSAASNSWADIGRRVRELTFEAVAERFALESARDAGQYESERLADEKSNPAAERNL